MTEKAKLALTLLARRYVLGLRAPQMTHVTQPIVTAARQLFPISVTLSGLG